MSATAVPPASIPPPARTPARITAGEPALARAAVTAKPAKTGWAPAGDSRNKVIDGYRGICAIGVVFGHTTLINQLIFNKTGHEATFTIFDVLPMFFALSGLMTYRVWVVGALSGKVRTRGPVISTRLWRIVPVYFALCLIVWAMRFADSPADWSDLALHLTFMQVWSPKYVFWLDGPAWFLADDLHFFFLTVLVGPMLCRLALRLPLTRWGVPGRILVMALLPVAMIAVGCGWIWLQIYHDHNTSTYVRYTPLFTMPEFAFGMLLGVFAFTPGVIKVRPKMALALTAGGLAALALIAHYSWHIGWMNIDNFGYPLISVFCCLLLLGALMAAPKGILSRIMGIKPLMTLAGIGLTILLVQEPLMTILEKWRFVSVWNPTDCWVSATLLLLVAAVVGTAATKAIEEPAMKLREKLARIRTLESGRDRRHRGPMPRRLPDVNLSLPDGEVIPVRSVLGDRPLLLAFGDAGAGALAEQRFRLDAGESTALHIVTDPDRSASASEQLGARVALDPEDRLARALNIPVALVEVGPDGLITSFQRSRREALGAWT